MYRSLIRFLLILHTVALSNHALADGYKSNCSRSVIIAKVDHGHVSILRTLTKEEKNFFKRTNFSKIIDAKYYRYIQVKCGGRQ